MLSTKIYDEGNKTGLVKLLKKCLGNSNVNEPHKSGNIAVKDYTINFEAICDYFIHDLTNIKEYKWSTINNDYVMMKELLEFMININHRTATTGLYHIYSKFVDTFFSEYINQQVDGNYHYVPTYSDIKDKKIKELITPKRDEFRYLRWILDNIHAHPFFSMFVKDLDIVYQKPIKPTDNKKYDMMFRNISLVVELQEEKKQHTDNPNDETKKAMVLLRGKRIVYFRMDLCSNSPTRYMEKLWKEELEKAILQGLVYKFHKNENQLITKLMNLEMTNQNLKELAVLEKDIKRYQQKVTKKKLDEDGKSYKITEFIQKEDLTDDEIISYTTKLKNIEDLKNLINPKNNNISTLFEWYQKCHGYSGKYLISPFDKKFRDIFSQFNFNEKEEFYQLLKLCFDAKYCGTEGLNSITHENNIDFSNINDANIEKKIKNLRFSWKGLEKIFLNPNDYINKKILSLLIPKSRMVLEARYMLNLLQVVRDTYIEKISIYMFEHSESINCSDIKLQDKIEEHIKNMYINKNKKEIEDSNRNYKILETEHENLKDKVDSIIKGTSTVIKESKSLITNYSKLKKKSKLNCPDPDELIESIEIIKKDLDDLKLIMNKNNTGKKTITFNNSEVDESIITEKPKLGILFTGNCKDNVEFPIFKGLCNANGIPKRMISHIVITLNNSNNPKPKLVERIRLSEEQLNKIKLQKTVISDSENSDEDSENEESDSEFNKKDFIKDLKSNTKEKLIISQNSDDSDNEIISKKTKKSASKNIYEDFFG